MPPFYIPGEEDFSTDVTAQWTEDNWNVAIGAVLLYLALVFIGPRIMANKEPFDLKYPLAAWNILLSLFSFIGACRSVPFLFITLYERGYEESICRHPNETWAAIGAVPLWCMLMNFSKFVELFDTVFIVLRKRPLIFLHWYHHMSVLLFCWSAYSIPTASGIYFFAMNYSVHALMYGYYGLKGLDLVLKSFPAQIITNVQTIQMFIGTFVCASGWYYRASGVICHNDIKNLLAGAAMYVSYLYLFIDFALKKYYFKKNRTTVKKTA